MTFEELMKENGYEVKTTFWMDFSIADRFGKKAIIDTFNRAFEEWHTNVEYITEMVLVLNQKIWQYYHKGNDALQNLYNELWGKLDAWCCNNLQGDDLRYFYQVTD